ncbi:hypothetical protein ISN45_Aa07g009860 [Arabidopsis thaliana x Arabidopsis arenosa]|uniref:Serine carboxypeptidase S28 family protein n=1 Tax=Arabidopsis thaliana x Arabidopsis arenosa TaxID=1240361 RepID=A0A8T1Y8L4_9BRAS|nr:hypothetical protein ISN45_Aa07g009860 [Arabidopsis thaliana x Arabidopsis arenosa]
MLDIAPKFQALLVFIEHRFYGESKPHNLAKTMGYLNSQQALADYAILIRSLKQNLSSESSPVVVFGGSYGGMLAAWFRLKYPHITIGALASSAPILQFDKIVPSSSFYDVVSQDFKDASLNCFEVIKKSWRELEVFSTMKDGLQELSKKFRTCKDLHAVYLASRWLETAYTDTAMVNYPTPANFMAPLPAYPVEEVRHVSEYKVVYFLYWLIHNETSSYNRCARSSTGFPLEASNLDRAFAAASLYYNYSCSENCFDIENQTDPHGLNGWYWQACTEMVMPISCSNQSMFQPFEYDEKVDQEDCLKEYGVKPRPHWITTEFGGHRIEMVLKRFGINIIFSNGMQDPWSREGVLKNISSSIIALVTKKGAHHTDLRAATKDDPEWLKEQRRQEVAEIEKWISEYYSDLRQEEQANVLHTNHHCCCTSDSDSAFSSSATMARRSGDCMRCLVIFAVVSALVVCGPALYWKFNKGFVGSTRTNSLCPPCVCDCPPPLSLLQIAPGLANLSITDCGSDDPELKQEMEKQFVDLLTEELKLQEAVADEHSRHMNVTLAEAKRVASQYQKEAEKCNAATEICESARERAEALLIKERKITSLWEKRARQSGWEGE